jgi:hypothetical protein
MRKQLRASFLRRRLTKQLSRYQFVQENGNINKNSVFDLRIKSVVVKAVKKINNLYNRLDIGSSNVRCIIANEIGDGRLEY